MSKDQTKKKKSSDRLDYIYISSETHKNRQFVQHILI